MLLFYFLCITISANSANVYHNFLTNVDNYVNLTTSVQRYYNAKSICILYSSPSDNLIVSTIILKVMKKFSSLETLSQAVHFSDLNSKYLSSTSRYSRQLFVLHVQDESGMSNFANFSHTSGLALHTWLVLSSSMTCDEFAIWRLRLEINTRLLVKCHDNEMIKEWYRFTRAGRTYSHELAKWNPERGLTVLDRRNMILRRQHFQGEKLRIASVKDYTFSPEARKKGTHLTNYQLVMNIIMNQMKVTPVSLGIEEYYGVFNKSTKRWTSGILGKLQRGEIDVAVDGLLLTRERLDYFDMAYPIQESRVRMFIKEPDYPIAQWTAYLKVFSPKTWLAIVITILISSIILFIIKMPRRKKICWRNDMLLENFLHVWGIYCQQGLSDRTDSVTLKVAYISLFCSSFVLTACYTASLYSDLRFFTPQLPFNNLKEFIKDKSYQLIVLRNKAEHLVLEPAMANELKRLAKSDGEMPYYYEEAFEQVCNERTAFYTIVQMRTIYFSKDVPCNLLEIMIGSRLYLSVGLIKGNPLAKFLDFYVRKLQESGILRHIRNHHVIRQGNYQLTGYKTVGLWEISPLIIILLVGYMMCIAVLILEQLFYYSIMYKKYKFKRRKVWQVRMR